MAEGDRRLGPLGRDRTPGWTWKGGMWGGNGQEPKLGIFPSGGARLCRFADAIPESPGRCWIVADPLSMGIYARPRATVGPKGRIFTSFTSFWDEPSIRGTEPPLFGDRWRAENPRNLPRRRPNGLPSERPSDPRNRSVPFEAPEPTHAERRSLRESAGLCADCRSLQVLRSPNSTFVRCGLSDHDERFPRYPPLPRHVCAGYVAHAGPRGPDRNDTDPAPQP
jgi:hypothetical protein